MLRTVIGSTCELHDSGWTSCIFVIAQIGFPGFGPVEKLPQFDKASFPAKPRQHYIFVLEYEVKTSISQKQKLLENSVNSDIYFH